MAEGEAPAPSPVAQRNLFPRLLALGVFAGIAGVYVLGRALLEWHGPVEGRVAQAAGKDEGRTTADEARDEPPAPSPVGSLTGVVRNAAGAPDARATVYLAPAEGGETSRTLADDAGRFRFDDLAPGPWRAWSLSTDASPGAEHEPRAPLTALQDTAVVIEAGEEGRVVLGPDPPRTVHVEGTVLCAGAPIAGALRLRGRGRALPDETEEAAIDAAGRFALDLPEPGPYLASVVAEGTYGANRTKEIRVEIPALPRYELRLDLPAGRIEGVVRGPDGAPVEDAELRLRIEGPTPPPDAPGGGLVKTWTDEEGRYAFAFLDDDTYGISVCPPSAPAEEDSPSLGRARAGGIVLAEGETRSGVDFRLETGGRIEGRVVGPGGEPASGATVFLRASDGTVVERFSRMTTGRNGVFGWEAVAPGHYTAFARTTDEASGESEPFSVGTGTAATVTLHLAPAARLLVLPVDGEGNGVPARLLVLDEEGRRVNGLRGSTRARPPTDAAPGSLPHAVGPLPPGRYRIEARGAPGVGRETVELDAGEVRRVRLPLE